MSSACIVKESKISEHHEISPFVRSQSALFEGASPTLFIFQRKNFIRSSHLRE